MRNFRTRLLFAVVLAMAAASCAIVLVASGSAADDGVFEVTLLDGEIEIEGATLAPGRQVVETENGGTGEHDLVMVRTDLAADELPVGLHGVSVSQAGELVLGEDHLRAGHTHAPGAVLGVRPGESRRHQVDLEPGPYILFCQTGSHYLAGERVALTVGAGS